MLKVPKLPQMPKMLKLLKKSKTENVHTVETGIPIHSHLPPGTTCNHLGHLYILVTFLRLRLLSKPGLWLILSIYTGDDWGLMRHITRIAIQAALKR